MLQLQWKSHGNDEQTVSPASVTEVTQAEFTTPTTLGARHNLNGTHRSGSDQINRQWTLTDPDGRVVLDMNSQALNWHFVVGAPANGRTGLQPATTYVVTVAPKNPDGSPSGVRMPCDYFLNLQNVGG